MVEIPPECNICGVHIRKEDKEDYVCWVRTGWCKQCAEVFGEEDTQVVERDGLEKEEEQESKVSAHMSKTARYRD